MKLAIIGSRDFQDKKLAIEVFELLFKSSTKEIVSGDCPTGADKIGKEIAYIYSIRYTGFPAKWDDLSVFPCKVGINKSGKKYNILAGFNRNSDIIKYCDMVLAFWNGSGGTKNSLSIARQLKKPTTIIYF